jgi:hypothetical protein
MNMDPQTNYYTCCAQWSHVTCECNACDEARRDRVKAFAQNFSVRAYITAQKSRKVQRRNERRLASKWEEGVGTWRPPAPTPCPPDKQWADTTDVVVTELLEWY